MTLNVIALVGFVFVTAGLWLVAGPHAAGYAALAIGGGYLAFAWRETA